MKTSVKEAIGHRSTVNNVNKEGHRHRCFSGISRNLEKMTFRTLPKGCFAILWNISMGYFRNLFWATVAFTTFLEVLFQIFNSTLLCFCKLEKRGFVYCQSFPIFRNILRNFCMSRGCYTVFAFWHKLIHHF